MSDFQRIRQLVFNRPWAITEDYLDVMAEVLVRAADEFAAGKTPTKPAEKPNALRMQDGVPVIEVDGVISKRMSMFSDVSGGTSIDRLSSQFDEAMATDAHAVVFNIHSPGGSVDGIDEFAQKVYDARASSNKTIIALADNMAASAAYWIGAQADEFYVSSGGSAGSIGVVARILDNSRALKNAGIDQLVIRSGDLKAPGVGPMSADQESSVVKEVQAYAQMFYDAVQRGRPLLNIDNVKRGQMFVGQEAVQVGLADGITTLNAIAKRYRKN
jgi:ClpP class serine protease